MQRAFLEKKKANGGGQLYAGPPADKRLDFPSHLMK